MMRFGIFSVGDHYQKELLRTSRDFYGELLEQGGGRRHSAMLDLSS